MTNEAHPERDPLPAWFVEVSQATCCGAGRCYEAAPEVFDLDDDGFVILLQREPSADQRSAVELAESNCPTGTVRIIDATSDMRGNP